ncbi:MAG: ThiF family adenylyltransferase, partial [Williamsia herbipolensis]|nr:ThiF family adenylyltransferase [Williamsia herbipolensis]
MTFPALVDPGPPLSRDEIVRYSRHLLLPDMGEVAQRRLRAASVLVVGAGGLGSAVLPYLAAAGVGAITVVDDDMVETSNLQRQVIHSASSVGRPKTDSAREALVALDPSIVVRTRRLRVGPDTVDDVVAGHDVVLDGSDNFETRYLVDAACARAGIPDVWGSVLQMEGMVSVFWAGHGPRYTDLHPQAPPPGAVPSCAEGGVLGALCGTIGTIMATQAVLLICGIGRPLVGRITVVDALDGGSRTIPLAPRTPVAAGIDDEAALPGRTGGGSAEPSTEFPVPTVSAAELARLLDATDPPLLVDVRETAELAIARIDAAVSMTVDDLVDAELSGRLPTGRQVVVLCRSGARSAAAVRRLRMQTQRQAVSLDGGILAWI